MMGMHEKTGKLLMDLQHVEQSVRRILRTQKGSIPMMRWFGLDLMNYIDQSMTSGWLLNLTSDIKDSIQRAIPSVRLISVEPETDGDRIKFKVRVVWQDNLVDVEG